MLKWFKNLVEMFELITDGCDSGHLNPVIFVLVLFLKQNPSKNLKFLS